MKTLLIKRRTQSCLLTKKDFSKTAGPLPAPSPPLTSQVIIAFARREENKETVLGMMWMWRRRKMRRKEIEERRRTDQSPFLLC